MITIVRDEVLRRLLLAKSLQRHGCAACEESNDILAFARGILLLHDAVEAGLGAVADHLNASLKDKIFLLDYYDLIYQTDPSHRRLPYRSQITALNAIRIGIKHKGVFPDIKQHQHFPVTVTELLRDLCQEYIAVDYDELSLKSMIKNEVVRAWIDEADKCLDLGEFENVLINLGYAIYNLLEFKTTAHLSSIMLGQKKPQQYFTKPHGVEFTVDLLEHGIDPLTYHDFRNLLPQMAYDTNTSQPIYHWDKSYGHTKNWTKKNAKFCLDYCIDCALKFERVSTYDYDLISYQSVYDDIIEPTNDEAILYNCSEGDRNIITGVLTLRKPIFTLRRGTTLVGFASSIKEHLDEWVIYSDDIPKTDSWIGSFGVVKKCDVSITTRERDTSSNNGESIP